MTSSDYWIETTNRKTEHTIQEVLCSTGLVRFNIHQPDVENCIIEICHVLQKYKVDVMIAAISLVFWNVCKVFRLQQHSLMGFAEVYLRSGEIKQGTQVLQLLLNHHFDTQVSRYEEVKLRNPVNITEVLQTPQEVLDEKNKVRYY